MTAVVCNLYFSAAILILFYVLCIKFVNFRCVSMTWPWMTLNARVSADISRRVGQLRWTNRNLCAVKNVAGKSGFLFSPTLTRLDVISRNVSRPLQQQLSSCGVVAPRDRRGNTYTRFPAACWHYFITNHIITGATCQHYSKDTQNAWRLRDSSICSALESK